MKAEEPYVGKPLVRFLEGRGGNWLHREHPVYSTPRSIMFTSDEVAERRQATLPDSENAEPPVVPTDHMPLPVS
jgi:hypothetical protein